MPNYANIQLIGHAGKDAELRKLQSGESVASFSMAVKDYKGVTAWYDVAVFGKTAESYVAPYLKKGNAVFVAGQPKLETFQRKDGTASAKISVVAREVQIMSGDKDEAEKTKPAASVASSSVSDDYEDSIPF